MNTRTQVKSDNLKTIMTEEWRSAFIGRLAKLDGFFELVDRSCQTISIAHRPIDFAALNMQARNLIASYDIKDLAAARQYYNNEHLVLFWKFYHDKLEPLFENGSVDRNFPVFTAEIDYAGDDFRVTPVKIDFLNSDVMKIGDDLLRRESVTEIHKSGERDLRDLFARLTILQQIQNKAFNDFHLLFLKQAQRAKNIVWDYYKIHYFLDNNLYPLGDGTYYRAPFDYVFFSSNITELKLFLSHCHASDLNIDINNVADFLGRQRKYYLQIALSLSLPENEIHNRRKDLRWYDPIEGVVKDGISDDLLRFYDETVVKKGGLVKQGGCPFAKTKGVRRNSLIEVFEYFDQMMIALLSHSTLFAKLFGARLAALDMP